MPSVRAGELEVAYDVDGSGFPLVVLHGATSSGREDFAAQLPAVRKTFRVYLPDARGHGRTRWDVADGFSQPLLTGDLAAFVDALGLQTFHLLGFSMGAMTAMTFATRWPERLRTLVLVGITPQREPRASVARRLMDPERILRDDPAWAADLSARHDPVQGVGAWQRLLPTIAHEVTTQPLLTPRELRGVTVPTLVAIGDRDPFVPVDHGWGLARQLPDSRLLVVPDCGHEVMNRQPSIFNTALAGFYRSTAEAARIRATEVAT
jgi:pimeloyl-ACP methyl ester carboxylesterase